MLRISIGALCVFLWLQLDWVIRGENVAQRPSTLSVQEGDSSVINCTYSDSASSYFPWYKQETGKGPQLIIHVLSNKNENKNGRFTVSLRKVDKHLSLSIEATQPGDAAVYFCAASPQCFPGTCKLCTNLRVEQRPLLWRDRTSSTAFVIFGTQVKTIVLFLKAHNKKVRFKMTQKEHFSGWLFSGFLRFRLR